jgi:spore coat protein U-like protein
MSCTRILIILGALFLASGLFSRQAAAQACSVQSTAASFGSYNPGSTIPNDTAGTVQVTCQLLAIGLAVPYTLTASAGSGGSFGSRKLLNGSAALAYQLYTDAGRSVVWGDGTGGSSAITGSLTAITGLIVIGSPIPIYGRIAAGQVAAVGSYSDTVLVTITY